MSSLSAKSDQEISALLDEYGVKHGPIVGTTRKLYEKKLREAMATNTKPSSADKTFYREEEEEVTYLTYHQPVRHEGFGDLTQRTGTRQYTDDVDDVHDFDDHQDHEYKPVIRRTQATYQTASYSKATPSKSVPARPSPETAKSGAVPGWLCVLVFIVIAVFLYYVFSTMEGTDNNPFNKITEQ